MWEIREKWEETYRIIGNNFRALEAEYAREIPYFKFRIELSRAYIKFGVMSKFLKGPLPLSPTEKMMMPFLEKRKTVRTYAQKAFMFLFTFTTRYSSRSPSLHSSRHSARGARRSSSYHIS